MVLAALSGRLEVILSGDLADELTDVLARPKFAKYVVDAESLAAILAGVGPFVQDIDDTPTMRDPADAMVVAAAVASKAQAIVTGDKDLLSDADLVAWLADRDIEVITPADLMAILDR